MPFGPLSAQDPLASLTSAKTFKTQLCLMDTFASLGSLASDFLKPALAPYLPSGKMLKHSNRFVKEASEMLAKVGLHSP